MSTSSGASIKIIHIIPTLALGGAERLVVDVCTCLPREAFESVVVVTVAGRRGFDYFLELPDEGFGVGIAQLG